MIAIVTIGVISASLISKRAARKLQDDSATAKRNQE
jgi:hypothetical protein